MSGDIPPGVTVFCDPALAPAMLALDAVARARAGAPVAVLCAPAPSMLAQIQRHTRNDVLFTLSSAMDQAVQLRLVRPETRIDGLSNRLVLVGLAGRFTPPAQDMVKPLVAAAKVAVTDNTVISGLDGAAILTANGLALPPGRRLIGAASTQDVAFLVATGAADIGLVYRTDAQADPRLIVLATLTADPALTSYSGAVNAHAVSPNAQTILGLVRGPGAAALTNAGLEIAA